MNLPVYNGTIFSSFFSDQNITPILVYKNKLRSCDENITWRKLLSDSTTEVDRYDAYLKRVDGMGRGLGGAFSNFITYPMVFQARTTPLFWYFQKIEQL